MWTNIKMKTRKIIAVLFTFVVALVIGATVKLQQSTAHADDADFNQVGASVRMGDQMGIRFTATIDEVDATSKYYVMIIPETWVDTYNLDEAGNKDYYDVLYRANKRSETSIATGYEAAATMDDVTMLVMESEPTKQNSGEYQGLYLVRGSIVEVKYENSNTKFFGVAFEQKANGERVYADGQEEYSYRNITNVASAALNDTETEYTPENITSLNKMVKDAYNVSLGNAQNEQVDLPTMSVHSNAALAVQNGSTYQASVKDLPDIGIDVDWRLVRTGSSTDMESEIDGNGKITVRDENITCNGFAKVLGNEIKFVINPTAKPDTGVLEDFSSSATRYSFGKGGVVNDGSVPYSVTLADIGGESANGLAGVYISRNSANKDATYRFALSAEDLKAAISEAETITVRMMVGTYYRTQDIDGDKQYDLNSGNYNGDSAEKGYVKFVGRDFVVPHNTWVDLTVTKTEFLNFFEGASETEKLNNFSVLGANNGQGIAGFTVCESYKITGFTNDADREMLFDAIYTDKANVAPLTATATRMYMSIDGGTYLESCTIGGETVNDVIRVTRKDNTGIKAKFALAADELSQITSVSFKVLLNPSSDDLPKTPTLRYNRGAGSNLNNGLVQQQVQPNVWTTITYTKEQLRVKMWWADFASEASCDLETAWANFCNAYSFKAEYASFVSMIDVSVSTEIYFADVTVNYN